MSKKPHHQLFNLIAPIYGWFYGFQKKHYHSIINDMIDHLPKENTVLDVGAGTGALCAALKEADYDVTGVDAAEKMINVAKKKTKKLNIQFDIGNALEGLPYQDNQFDVLIASYVAHGLKLKKRKKLYHEMARIANKKVIIYDYNDNRNPLTTFVEWAEGGEYFQFIQDPVGDLESCQHELETCFKSVEKINVSKRAAWYICIPNN
jgi:ubiquinone/menaquinone biosynthesis C-methylase UbiE